MSFLPFVIKNCFQITELQQLAEQHIQLKKEMINLKESIGLYEEKQCKRQEHIYFLKTSKTGSTTIGFGSF